MRRVTGKFAVLVGMSIVAFKSMQLLFDGLHSADFGEKYGFPFPYMQDGTFTTKGHVLWVGLIADFAIAVTVSAAVLWLWRSVKFSKQAR